MSKKKKNIFANLTIEKYVAEGKCMSHLEDGKVIFIEHAIPGDEVMVMVTKSKKDFAEGRIQKIINPSPLRQEAFCSHFGTCGGCQWQSLPYAQQLVFKQQQVIDQLTRISHQPLPECMPILGCDKTEQYRNKIEYTFSNKKFLSSEEISNKEISPYQDVAGYHVRGIFDKIIDIDTCHLQAEPTNKIRKFVKQYCIDNKMPFYDLRMHTGWLRTMQIRLCNTGELMVNIVVKFYDEVNLNGLCSSLQTAFPEITTLLYTINDKVNDSYFGLTPVTFSGTGYAVEKLGNYSFKIGPKSFFQTNSSQAEKLYEVTKNFAELKDGDVLYDLYCGTGSIGIFCSDKASKIIGVEMVEEAIDSAKENADLNNVNNAHFFAGAAEKVCTDSFFKKHGTPNVIITDPPRAGMHDALIQALLRIAAPTIVYVSCNPATQARDIALLAEKYKVTKIQPVDMFPHTHHIENVLQLQLI
jgi:23S rRNA (uracil1939-C5)-methyltransferase